jgi:S-DNA-T family DNA segregation ATPase FtsK/SpoIIIE
MELNQASASMLQRKFRIGYTRASRLIDTMEEMKIIGPNMGSKPRDIIMTYDQVCERYFNNVAQSSNTDSE